MPFLFRLIVEFDRRIFDLDIVDGKQRFSGIFFILLREITHHIGNIENAITIANDMNLRFRQADLSDHRFE